MQHMHSGTHARTCAHKRGKSICSFAGTTHAHTHRQAHAHARTHAHMRVLLQPRVLSIELVALSAAAAKRVQIRSVGLACSAATAAVCMSTAHTMRPAIHEAVAAWRSLTCMAISGRLFRRLLHYHHGVYVQPHFGAAERDESDNGCE